MSRYGSDPVDWIEAELDTVEFYDLRLKRRLFKLVGDFYAQAAQTYKLCGIRFMG